MKRLFVDLSRGGHEAFRQRFENALHGKDTRVEVLTDLVGEIPPATVHAARRAWFPHLLDEMKSVAVGAARPRPLFLSLAAPVARQAGLSGRDGRHNLRPHAGHL